MFASLQNKRKLEEATSSRDDVAPVYLLEEIWDLVRTSSPDVVAGMVMYLNSRLANKSPIVKQKTCRLIKYICAKGSSEFKKNISKHAASVRELTSYKGEPDPFKGDVPNQRVRDMAKEALDAMFAATDPSYSVSSQQPSFASRIQGFGSSGEASGAGGGSISSLGASSSGTGGSSRMMGFGNPKYEPPGSNRDSSSVVSPKAILGQVVEFANQARAALPQARSKSFLRPDEGDDSPGEDSASGAGYSQPRLVTAAGPYGPPAGGSGVGVSGHGGSGADEEQLVETICTPGGLRAQPDREHLRLFVEGASGASGQRIAQLLQAKIEGASWQVTLRALCALEAVIQQGSSASCGEIAVYFQADPSSVQKAAASPQASVKQRGARVLQLLGVSSNAPPAAAKKPASAAAPPQSAAPDLLGDLLGDAAQPSAPPHTGVDLLGDLLAPQSGAAASTAAAGGLPKDSLFGGLDVGGRGSQAAAGPSVASQGSLLEGLDFGTPAPSGSQQNGNAAGLQGGLPGFAAGPALGGTSAAPPPPMEGGFFTGLSVPGSAAKGPGTVDGVVDLLGGLAMGPSPSQAPPHSNLLGVGGGLAQHPMAPTGLGTPGAAPFGGSAQGLGGGPSLGPRMANAGPAFPGPAGVVHMGAHGMYPGAPGVGPQSGYSAVHYMPQGPGLQGGYGGTALLGTGMPYGGALPSQEVSTYGGLTSTNPGGLSSLPMGSSIGRPAGGSALFDSSQESATKAASSLVGITSESTFDFVGDHISLLRSQK